MDRSALIIVDLQNDFISGSLKVKNYSDMTQRINDLQKKFEFVILTKDNHPFDHISFTTSIIIENDLDLDIITKKYLKSFPPHCIQNTWGNELDKELVIKENAFVVMKGENKYKEEFSGFSNENLNSFLIKNDVKNVFVCGLVYEFCVGSTCIDSKLLGYNTYLVKDLTISLNENKDIDTDNDKLMEYNNINNINEKLVKENRDDILLSSLGCIYRMSELLKILNVKEIYSNEIEKIILN